MFETIGIPIGKLCFLNKVKNIIVLKNVDNGTVKPYSRDTFYCLNSFVYPTNSDVLIKINDFIQIYIARKIELNTTIVNQVGPPNEWICHMKLGPYSFKFCQTIEWIRVKFLLMMPVSSAECIKNKLLCIFT